MAAAESAKVVRYAEQLVMATCLATYHPTREVKVTVKYHAYIASQRDWLARCVTVSVRVHRNKINTNTNNNNNNNDNEAAPLLANELFTKTPSS